MSGRRRLRELFVPRETGEGGFFVLVVVAERGREEELFCPQRDGRRRLFGEEETCPSHGRRIWGEEGFVSRERGG
jgi:hypothetical protein